MLYAYDSATPPNRQAIKTAGGTAGARYIKRNLPNSYDLGSTERLGWLADGLGLLYNAEQSANDVLVQSTSWWRDYGKYTADRLQAFGVPTDKGINVAASADCQVIGDANLSKAISNLAAFATGVEPFGTIGYGQISVLNLLTLEGISPKGAKHWLTASLGWSGYPNTAAGWNAYMAHPLAGMVQMLGSNVAGTDMNYLLDPLAMGFEWPTTSPYYPKPKEVPVSAVYGWVYPDANPEWLIAPDLQSKVAINAADAAVLSRATDFGTPGVAGSASHMYGSGLELDPATVAAIPVAGAVAVTIPPVEVTVVPTPPSTYNFAINGTATPEASA